MTAILASARKQISAKNFGQIERMAVPKSSILSFLNIVGAIIDTWKTIIPAIAPGM